MYCGVPKWYPKGFEVSGENNFCALSQITLDDVPENLNALNQPSRIVDRAQTGIHFYIEDFKFRPVIREPGKAVAYLFDGKCVLTPDITIASGLARYQRIVRTSLSRMVGAFYESRQIKVIPSLRWASISDFDFLLDGIPRESVFSVSTVGKVRNREDRHLFQSGVMLDIKRLSPVGVMIYGTISEDFAAKVEKETKLFRDDTPTSLIAKLNQGAKFSDSLF